jgi:tripartite ATP-independent transporter DctP family solute receptor
MSKRLVDRTSRRRFLAATVAGPALASFALRSAFAAPAIVKLAKKLTMKCATITPESFPYVDGLRKWKQLAEERTAGTLEMQIFHTAQLGDERTINEGLLAGSVQAGIGAGAWAGYVPAYNVVELPFLIRDLPQMYRLADGELGTRIGQQAENKGFKVLAYYSAGDQHFQTRTKPIRSLEDFQGLKLRVIENKALVEGFRALGAVPAPLPYPQIYTAVQQGTVDGSANDLLSVTSLRLYEVAKYFTMSSYVVEPRPLIVSKRFFDGLPADFRDLLVETARESATFERKVFEEKVAAGRQEAEKGGMTFLTLSDRDKWVDRVRPVWDEFGKSTPGAAELIQIIQRS